MRLFSFLLFWMVLLKLINPLLKDREPPKTGFSNDPLKLISESIKKLKLSFSRNFILVYTTFIFYNAGKDSTN